MSDFLDPETIIEQPPMMSLEQVEQSLSLRCRLGMMNYLTQF
jgi:hypothetical protein